MKIEKQGSQYIYSWTDDLGFHEYIIDDKGYAPQIKTIINFTRKKLSNGIIYSWNDNLGFHNYIIDDDIEKLENKTLEYFTKFGKSIQTTLPNSKF